MLVLSRRVSEKIVFPGIQTSVTVAEVNRGRVRLAIDAPTEVSVVRGELLTTDVENHAHDRPKQGAEAAFRELRHLMRNRLNVTTVGLALLRQQLKAGLTDDAERTFSKLEDEMQMLGQRLEKESIPPPAPQRATRPRKALLVEDDRNERELLAGFLRISGFTVDTAGDGCDALDHLQVGDRPDVVLLDMGLPRCDGPTTAREIRRNPGFAGLKIFAVSGHSPEEYGLTTGQGLIDRWFNKPLDPALLLRELSHELRAS